MKVKLQIHKAGVPIYTGIHDVTDADSFGKACADAWSNLQQKQVEKESSIGALYEHLADNVMNQLDGANISFDRM